jgi:hypothetical protein
MEKKLYILDMAWKGGLVVIATSIDDAWTLMLTMESGLKETSKRNIQEFEIEYGVFYRLYGDS